ncbi:MAG TPA: M28 family peptidase, partial [Blastocatellia bacterium]|nr:M28 family peptidase [Blastocatellia bacterium]
MKKLILTSLLFAGALAASPAATHAQRKQENKSLVAAATMRAGQTGQAGDFGNVEGITAAQLKDYLYFVASDEMEGRNTPSRGLDLTAKFLALNLSRWGLKPAGDDGSFLQKIALTSRAVVPEQSSASVGGQSFKIGEDFLAAPYPGTVSGKLVFVGNGYVVKAKNINAYQGIDVKDKIMLVAEGLPKGVNFQDFRGKQGEDFDTPETYAAAHGAKGIIYVAGSSTLNFWDQRFKSSQTPSRPTMERPGRKIVPIIIASAKMATAILQGEKLDYETLKKQMGDATVGEAFALSDGKEAGFTAGAKVDAIMTQNVVGILEGSDPVLKNEYVAVGAHYDHVGNSQQTGCRPIGNDNICNGADDDGSGTVAVLAIAEALAKGPRPKRSVLFVWHCGEEKGLWGSAFINETSPVPGKQIITQLNIDMIGRSKKDGDTDRRNAELSGPNEIYVIGSKMMSSYLAEVSEQVNKAYLNLKFNYKYDDPNDTNRFFYRSDHFNYAKKGIPIIFYFDGVHEDYHQVGDSPDKIDYQ